MARGPQNPALPDGAEYLGSSSGNQANANAVATLTPRTGKTAYLSEFTITGAGATAGLAVVATITGVVGGTRSSVFTFPAGAGVGATPLIKAFTLPIKATAPDIPIVITLPASGVGGLNAAVAASGYSF